MPARISAAPRPAPTRPTRSSPSSTKRSRASRPKDRREKELADAKNYLIGSYPLRFDTSTDIADALLGIQLDDLGIDYVNKRNDLIAAVTIDDVRSVAKRLFGGNDEIVVKVGQPAS